MKKVFGALSVSQSSTAGVKPLSHGLRRDSSPSRGALGRPSRFRGLALRYCLPCCRNVISALRQKSVLERQRSDRKMNLMPRPPLLGEVASSVSDDDGEVQPQQPLPVVNLSVTGFAVTAPLVGEPLAGRRVFGVWRFATVCPAAATLFLPCGRSRSWSASDQIEK